MSAPLSGCQNTRNTAVKKILASEMVIKPFNPSLPMQILCDASRLCSLGYALCNV